ncbi:hypothetical protein VT50_0223975 [Streptomyces antioxidans]|uniref:Uncharacterized protein n=1 Tax=Streptomyces antioxidans TaxID=1507734 RepID=A0A1V4D1E0_9ACTN|nr:hypothetical protein VT50_0223975 [Streptomyces antioxidans]
MTKSAPASAPAPAPEAAAAPATAPVAEAELRASDADRDRVADILREALAEGRLQPEEHAERIDAVYRAKTLGELEPPVRDLPAAPIRGAASASSAASASGRDAESEWPRSLPASENLVAVFGGSVRKGRWRVRRRTNALAVFGGVEIDLTEAVFEQREIVIHVVAAFGGVEIKVPENVSLRGSGAGILGGFDVTTYEAQDPDAPVIHVTGFAVFGGVEAKPKRGKRLKNLRA